MAKYRSEMINQVDLHGRKAVKATKNAENKIETENIVASLTKRSKQPYQFVAEQIVFKQTLTHGHIEAATKKNNTLHEQQQEH